MLGRKPMSTGFGKIIFPYSLGADEGLDGGPAPIGASGFCTAFAKNLSQAAHFTVRGFADAASCHKIWGMVEDSWQVNFCLNLAINSLAITTFWGNVQGDASICSSFPTLTVEGGHIRSAL